MSGYLLITKVIKAFYYTKTIVGSLFATLSLYCTDIMIT